MSEWGETSEECYENVSRPRWADQDARADALAICDALKAAEEEALNPNNEVVNDSDDEELEDLIEEEEEEEEEEEKDKKPKVVVVQAGFGGMGTNTILVLSVIGLLLIYAYKTK